MGQRIRISKSQFAKQGVEGGSPREDIRFFMRTRADRHVDTLTCDKHTVECQRGHYRREPPLSGVRIGLARSRLHGPLSGSRLTAGKYERNCVSSSLVANIPCAAGVRREPRCLPRSNLKAQIDKGMGLGHRDIPGAGAAIRHSLQRSFSAQLAHLERRSLERPKWC